MGILDKVADVNDASNDFSDAAALVVTKESEKQNKVVEVADKEAERVAKDALVVSAEEDRVAKETLAADKKQERVAKGQEATTAFDAKKEELEAAKTAKKLALNAVTACDGETTCNNGDALATALANSEVVEAAKIQEERDAEAAKDVANDMDTIIESATDLTALYEYKTDAENDLTIASNDFSAAAALVVTKESEKQSKVVEVADKEAERVAKDALVVSAEEDRVAKETLAAGKTQERVAKAQEATTAFDAKTEEYKVAVAAKKVAQDAVTACDGETTCNDDDGALATALANAEVVEAAKTQERTDAEAANDVTEQAVKIGSGPLGTEQMNTKLTELQDEIKIDIQNKVAEVQIAEEARVAAAGLVDTNEDEKQSKVEAVAAKEVERVAKVTLAAGAEQDRLAKETLAADKKKERVAKEQEAT